MSLKKVHYTAETYRLEGITSTFQRKVLVFSAVIANLMVFVCHTRAALTKSFTFLRSNLMCMKKCRRSFSKYTFKLRDVDWRKEFLNSLMSISCKFHEIDIEILGCMAGIVDANVTGSERGVGSRCICKYCCRIFKILQSILVQPTRPPCAMFSSVDYSNFSASQLISHINSSKIE